MDPKAVRARADVETAAAVDSGNVSGVIVEGRGGCGCRRDSQLRVWTARWQGAESGGGSAKERKGGGRALSRGTRKRVGWNGEGLGEERLAGRRRGASTTEEWTMGNRAYCPRSSLHLHANLPGIILTHSAIATATMESKERRLANPRCSPSMFSRCRVRTELLRRARANRDGGMAQDASPESGDDELGFTGNETRGGSSNDKERQRRREAKRTAACTAAKKGQKDRKQRETPVQEDLKEGYAPCRVVKLPTPPHPVTEYRKALRIRRVSMSRCSSEDGLGTLWDWVLAVDEIGPERKGGEDGDGWGR
ncbi:hypothetical protein C8R45DRAFT_921743 [Mycena sanguinolenta]|nr:hypothetical protein C8R45DRAFT_921743 [Mycena sanguinolenta]